MKQKCKSIPQLFECEHKKAKVFSSVTGDKTKGNSYMLGFGIFRLTLEKLLHYKVRTAEKYIIHRGPSKTPLDNATTDPIWHWIYS